VKLVVGQQNLHRNQIYRQEFQSIRFGVLLDLIHLVQGCLLVSGVIQSSRLRQIHSRIHQQRQLSRLRQKVDGVIIPIGDGSTPQGQVKQAQNSNSARHTQAETET
jgi:hypothetical protein